MSEPTPAEIKAIIDRMKGLINEETAKFIWMKDHGIELPKDPDVQTLKILGFEAKNLGGYDAIQVNVDEEVQDTGYKNFTVFNDWGKSTNKANGLIIGKTYDIRFGLNKKGKLNMLAYTEVSPKTISKVESVQKTNSEIKPASEVVTIYNPTSNQLPKGEISIRKKYYSMDREELIEAQKNETNGAISGHIDNLILANDQYHMLNEINKSIISLGELMKTFIANLTGLEKRRNEESATIKAQMDGIKFDLMKAIEKNQADKKGKKEEGK